MRKSVLAAGGAAIAVIAVLAITLSGVLRPSESGTAVPNEPTLALKELSIAARSLANAPSAVYSGTVTVRDGDNLKLDAVTVTAAGDVSGVVTVDGGRADVLQLGGQTFVKGDEKFWENRRAVLPLSVDNATDADGEWTIASDTVFGIDLRALLRPVRLGLVVDQQDQRYGRAEIPAAGSDSPDRRGTVAQDPVGVTEVEVTDNDGGVPGAQRFTAGEMTVGVDDGALVAVRGPLGTGFAGDDHQVSGDLTVTVNDADATRGVYAKMKDTAGGLGTVALWSFGVPEPDGDMNCTYGVSCVLSYTVANTAPGMDRGEVVVTMRSTFKIGGADLGTCRSEERMPLNNRVRISCSVKTDSREGTVESQTRFTVAGRADVDTAALAAAADASIKTLPSGEAWTAAKPKSTEPARRYNRQITLAPSGYVVKVGDATFDGRETDGTLLLVFSPGYDEHVLPVTTFDPAWSGTDALVEKIRAARAAAGDTPVRLVFAEGRAADAARALLAANGIDGVEVVVVPLA